MYLPHVAGNRFRCALDRQKLRSPKPVSFCSARSLFIPPKNPFRSQSGIRTSIISSLYLSEIEARPDVHGQDHEYRYGAAAALRAARRRPFHFLYRGAHTPPLVRTPVLAQFFPLVYVRAMTQAVTQILSEFEQLSEKERQELRRAIVERVPMSDDLTDDDFAALAAASFRALDEEENQPRA